MGWEFDPAHHVRPNVFYYSPRAHQERVEVKSRRDEAQQHYSRAKKFIEDGKYEEAEKQLEVAVACWPDNARFLLAMADCVCDLRSEPERALTWYDMLVEAQDTPKHRASRAHALACLGCMEDALADCESAVAGDKKNGAYIKMRGMIRQRMGSFYEAMLDYTTAIPLLKEQGLPTVECVFNRGYCHRLQFNHDEALRDFEAAALGSPATLAIKTCIGYMYLLRRRYSEALAQFQVVLATSRMESAALHNNVGLAQYLLAYAELEEQELARAATKRTPIAKSAAGASSKPQQVKGIPSAAPPLAKTGSTSSQQPPRRTMAAAAGSAVKAVDGGGAVSVREREHPRRMLSPELMRHTGSTLPYSPSGGNRSSRRQVGEAFTVSRADTVRGGAAEVEAEEVGEQLEGSLVLGADGDGEDSGLSDDDEDFEAEVAAARQMERDSNEDPKQWALSVLQGGLRDVVLQEDDKRRLLEEALEHFNKAMALYQDEEARAKAVEKSSGDVHAVHVNEPANITDGFLLVLTNMVRMPGTAMIHDRELEDGEIQYNRGLTCLGLGQLGLAEEDFQEALRSNPTHAHYPHYRAVVQARKGNFLEAVRWNNQSLSLNPQYFPALYHLGLILHLLLRNAEALQRLDAALLLQPKNWAVMEARGRVLQELDRHAEALPALRDALHYLDPCEPHIVCARLHYAVGQSAIVTHNPQLLKDSLREARVHGQDAASVYSLRGLLAHRERKLGKALHYMTRAIRLAPQEARFVFDRSQVHLERGDLVAAIADMTTASTLLPGCATLHYHRGMAYFRMLKDVAALEDFETAAESVTKGGGGQEAGVLRADRRLWEGVKFMTNGGPPTDYTASLWYHLGCTRAQLKRFKAASDAFARAAAFLPNHPALLHEQAKALQACGDFQKALELFTRVLQLQPRNPHALFRRGLAYRSLKMYERAAEDIERAKALDPTNPSFHVDYRSLAGVNVIELCRPGSEALLGEGDLVMPNRSGGS